MMRRLLGLLSGSYSQKSGTLICKDSPFCGTEFGLGNKLLAFFGDEEQGSRWQGMCLARHLPSVETTCL